MASIEKRGKNSYRLIVEAGYDASGKRIKKTKTVKAEGIREARKLLAEFQTEVEVGEYISPEKMKFEDFVEEWRKKHGSKTISPRTLDIYLRFLKNRILPVFGHMRLDQITTYHIENFLHDISEEGRRHDGKEGRLSSGTVYYLYRVLKNVISYAVKMKLISKKDNPFNDVTKPKVKHKEIEVYETEEINTLFQALENEPIHWRIMITLAITTGLRRGELVGLEWKHINLDKGTLKVEQTISMFKNGEPIITEPKTEKSKRTLSLSDSMVEELKEYKKHIHDQLDKIGDAWKGGNHFFVFCNPDGKPFYPETPYLHFRSFLKKHGLRYIRFHDLRHTAATLLISQGVHAKIISERLGHASITTTMNVYGHALQSADKEAANKYDNIIPFKNRKANA
ncbi:site-specific integrase [Brevibacillus sp. RS1.1]|uniref:tyrosine-type recombinase/integrase n=1 Tax=Brevibacillus sp. RS1.1 TaxID=2738982 RepID=UPI00156A7D0A|nr:tyrosine-type recombinase/integrase [Brevibacillus sp. RS1.1]NRR04562.1 site-specific integrase [Brevibacillus sp. RS1.1]